MSRIETLPITALGTSTVAAVSSIGPPNSHTRKWRCAKFNLHPIPFRRLGDMMNMNHVIPIIQTQRKPNKITDLFFFSVRTSNLLAKVMYQFCHQTIWKFQEYTVYLFWVCSDVISRQNTRQETELSDFTFSPSCLENNQFIVLRMQTCWGRDPSELKV